MSLCGTVPYIAPSVQDFKDKFYRDFPYGDTLATVQDRDIQSAYDDVDLYMNPGLFCDQSHYTQGYLLLAAHFLVTNLRNSTQGIAGQYEWLVGSKAVGSVSESLQIPQRIMDNPSMAMLTKTSYGAKYLFLILPNLVGPAMIVAGATLP